MVTNGVRTLVVILSETRAHELTFPGFRKNVLDANAADLALCVAENEREDRQNPFYETAKYIWTYPEPEDWGDAFDRMQDALGGQGDWRRLLQVGDQWLGGVRDPDHEHPGSAGILLFFRSFLRTALIQSGVIDRYDRFVITRSDYMHELPHVPISSLSEDHVWLPYGEDYGGYTDRHMIVSREDVARALSIADDIVLDPDGLFAAMQARSRWNLERFIKLQFDRNGLSSRVRRFPPTMFTVRAVDGHTRWSRGTYRADLGYFVKYPGEYRRARLCKSVLGNRSAWTGPRLLAVRALFWTLARLRAAKRRFRKSS